MIGHLQTIVRISEENKLNYTHHVALAVSYDELRRRSWSERAMRCDSSLDITSEVWVINRDMFDLAKQRLDNVVAAAGLTKHKAFAPNSSVGASAAASLATTESTLAKQTAAADAATRKAEQAIARLDAASSSGGRPSPQQPRNNGGGKPKGGHGGDKGGKGGGKPKGGQGHSWWQKGRK